MNVLASDAHHSTGVCVCVSMYGRCFCFHIIIIIISNQVEVRICAPHCRQSLSPCVKPFTVCRCVCVCFPLDMHTCHEGHKTAHRANTPDSRSCIPLSTPLLYMQMWMRFVYVPVLYIRAHIIIIVPYLCSFMCHTHTQTHTHKHRLARARARAPQCEYVHARAL